MSAPIPVASDVAFAIADTTTIATSYFVAILASLRVTASTVARRSGSPGASHNCK